LGDHPAAGDLDTLTHGRRDPGLTATHIIIVLARRARAWSKQDVLRVGRPGDRTKEVRPSIRTHLGRVAPSTRDERTFGLGDAHRWVPDDWRLGVSNRPSACTNPPLITRGRASAHRQSRTLAAACPDGRNVRQLRQCVANQRRNIHGSTTKHAKGGTSGQFALVRFLCLSASVDAGTAKGRVHTVAARDCVIVGAPARYVIAWPGPEDVVANSASEPVVPGPRAQILRADPADQDVSTPPTDEDIVPQAAEDPVRTWTAAESVVVRPAEEPVTARAPEHQIVDIPEAVVGLVSEDRVVARTAEDRRTFRAAQPPDGPFTHPIVAPAAINVGVATQQVVPTKSMEFLATPSREDHVWPSGPTDLRSDPRLRAGPHNRRRLPKTPRAGASLGDGDIRGGRSGEQEHNCQG
jgi:hypothetical protein